MFFRSPAVPIVPGHYRVRYVGWHGTWVSGTARFARRTKMAVTVDGDVLRARGWEGAPRRRFSTVYRRIVEDQPSRPGLLTRAARLLRSPSRHSGQSGHFER